MSAGPPFLFASDLDGTLLPNTGRTPAAGCLERTRDLLTGLRRRAIPICYVTGRHLSLARKGVHAFRLAEPDCWICNVGTEIHRRDGAADADWERELGPELDCRLLRQALAGIPGLSVQEASKQGRHKFSLYYSKAPPPSLCADILQRAGAVAGGLQLVVSLEEASGRGLLDLIPAKAGKRHAVEFSARRFGVPAERVFFAGDSGNDLDVLVSGVCGTLVGNTPDPVRSQAVRRQGSASRVYVASGCYGDGVIEGLRHYGYWPPAEPQRQPARPRVPR